MWLYGIAGVLILMGLVGSIAGGGIFTIVLIPIGLVIAGSALLYSMWNRAAQGGAEGQADAAAATNRPLPHTQRGDSGHAPTSPERLADARRTQQ